MLQNSTSLVLLDTLRHHIQNVVHDSCSELQVKVGLNTLLGDLQQDKQLIKCTGGPPDICNLCNVSAVTAATKHC